LVAARLRLAVADATGDETLWEQLLATTVPGSPDTPSDVAALILARRGRKLFQDRKLDSAVTHYRNAFGRGGQVKQWQDAANWAASAKQVLYQAEVIDFELLQSIDERESALRGAGPGTLVLVNLGYDARANALAALLRVTPAKPGPARTARVDLRRYLKRAIILGELDNEIDAHELLAQLYLNLDNAGLALHHCLAAVTPNKLRLPPPSSPPITTAIRPHIPLYPTPARPPCAPLPARPT
jgi:hypothetical protein